MENRVKALLRAMHDVVAMQIRVRSKPADIDHFLEQMMRAFKISGQECTTKDYSGILQGYRKRMMQKADAFRSKSQLLAIKRGQPRKRRRTRTKGAEETTDTEGEKTAVEEDTANDSSTAAASAETPSHLRCVVA